MSDVSLAAVDRPLGPFARRPLGWWGVVIAIITEATLFALLLFSYFFLWVDADEWPLDGIEPPKLASISVRTVLLIGSSIPAQLAEYEIKRGQSRRFVVYILTTMVMASIFLAGHVADVINDWDEFRPSTNAYASLFYTITNLHALHLIVGLGFLAFILVRGIQGRYSTAHHTEVEVVVLYWHFVDGVWIAVFASLYLAVGLK